MDMVKEIQKKYEKKIYDFFNNAKIGEIIGFGGACFVEKIENNSFKQCFDWWLLEEGETYELDDISSYYAISTSFKDFLTKDMNFINRVKAVDKKIRECPKGTVVEITSKKSGKVVEFIKMEENIFVTKWINSEQKIKYEITEIDVTFEYDVDFYEFILKYPQYIAEQI